MTILNLVITERSLVKYKLSKYPDGQQQVVVGAVDDTEVQIVSRLNDFKDLELIICAVKSLQHRGVEAIHLYVPYFMGARSDRRFEYGDNHYLRDVICPIVNGLGFKTVTVMDPHSDVLEGCLNNFVKTDNTALVKYAINDIKHRNRENSFFLMAPDNGASKKIVKLAENIGYTDEILICSKERDVEGWLTQTTVPFFNLEKDILIVDDICDGGRTFINIVKVIQERYDRFVGDPGRIFLVVTHGIFSAGFGELAKYFDGIYCTNSYSTVGDYVGNSLQKTKTKQVNVF